jgi:hypothetical protein
MIGTITFGRGQQAETFGVLEVMDRYVAGETGELSTVRIKLNRPYKDRTVLTTPENRVVWMKDPATALREQAEN